METITFTQTVASSGQEAKEILHSGQAQRGLVMCYIGAGKGKTTAGMGMCVRAAGAGMNVYILQFVKAKRRDEVDRTSEGEWPLSAEIDYFNGIAGVLKDCQQQKDAANIGHIVNEQAGLGFVGILGDSKEKAEHVAAAKAGLARAREVLHSGKWQLVFLDEIISAVEVGVLEVEDVVALIKDKPQAVHLLLTGHNKFDEILELCDLVTEMKMLKHPYYQGLLAQRGIDY